MEQNASAPTDASFFARPRGRLTLDVPTWRKLNSGELSAPTAFLTRRVKLEGNLGLALKLHFIIG